MLSTQRNKTIILALPYLYSFDQSIEKNLRHLGYDVINLCYDESRTHYPSILHRIFGWGVKFFSRPQYLEFKKRQTYSRYLKSIKEKLAQLGDDKADYALCIRANVYPKSIIELIRKKSKKCVNFQWDGIDAYPDILEYMDYFDRFFVFDPNDITKYPQYQLTHLTNFYFDYDVKMSNKVEHKAFFLGGYQVSRTHQIQNFIAKAKQVNLPLDFYIIARDNRARVAFNNESAIHYVPSHCSFTFEQNLVKVQESSVVVDFLNMVHKGLSFRSFDALGFNKKLITTNETVKKYDFYHPNNILVWNDEVTTDELSHFLSLPCQPISNEIKQKYSFTAWLSQLLA